MSSLYQLYKHKDKNGTGTVVNKTYTVPLSELYVEPGLNIREIDQITSLNSAMHLSPASRCRRWTSRLPRRA